MFSVVENWVCGIFFQMHLGILSYPFQKHYVNEDAYNYCNQVLFKGKVVESAKFPVKKSNGKVS